MCLSTIDYWLLIIEAKSRPTLAGISITIQNRSKFHVKNSNDHSTTGSQQQPNQPITDHYYALL